MKKNLPVYNLKTFKTAAEDPDFYANSLGPHVKNHAFTNLPHKHDFYLVMLVTKGSGYHEIDFERYRVEPGSVFLMRPGQMHFWKFSEDIEGSIFFHSKTFFDLGFTSLSIHDFPFFQSNQTTSKLKIPLRQIPQLQQLMDQINLENNSDLPLKKERLMALTSLVYIELTRHSGSRQTIKESTYLNHAIRFEQLIEREYRKLKLPRDYAEKLNISEKHLNRVSQACFGKTSTQLIAERVVLEIKRLLMQSSQNVTQISDELGFSDPSYLIRLFKRHCGKTPKVFFDHYKKRR